MNEMLVDAICGSCRRQVSSRLRIRLLLATYCAWMVSGGVAAGGNPDGILRIELISGYNFVVDSNVETPATYAPRSAYLGATYYNDGDVALTNVYAYIGDYDGGTNPTPGIYPSRAHLSLIGPLPGNEFALPNENSLSAYALSVTSLSDEMEATGGEGIPAGTIGICDKRCAQSWFLQPQS